MSQNTEATPLVAVIMGSQSDWNVMKNAVDTLEALGILCEAKILSAHRTPDAALKFAVGLQGRGGEVLIAAAGGAAHLAGVMAAHTMIPVLGVPMESKINGLDSLLATVQMPAGIPGGTLAIGKAGAINSALLSAAILAGRHPKIASALAEFRKNQTEKIEANSDPRKA